MENQQITHLKQIFASRLATLSHLLDVAETHFGPEVEAQLQQRIAPDMFPLGTQIAFACNQPLGFAQWCAGKPIENLNPEVTSLAQARSYIADTQAQLAAVAVDDSQLAIVKRIQLGPVRYLELPGFDYVHDFLMPNFYFHVSTAYNILRLAGVAVGKADFMRHIGPLVKEVAQVD